MVSEAQFLIEENKAQKDYGRFTIGPLPAGMGHTLGNSLRRALLIVLPGAAITQMKVSGASHLFSTLKGVKEDLIEIMLNIKQLRFTYEGEKPAMLKLDKKGPGEVKGKDLSLPAGVKLINPDLVLAHLADKSSSLKMDLTLEKGWGYSLAEEHKGEKIGIIAVDAIFSPVIRANYKVEATRVGKKTNWDNLIIELWTDGTISPKEALRESSRVLERYFQQIIKPKTVKAKAKEEAEDYLTEELFIEDLELPLRLTNALKAAGFSKVDDLIAAGKNKVKTAKNVGEKSLKMIEKILKKKGFSWEK